MQHPRRLVDTVYGTAMRWISGGRLWLDSVVAGRVHLIWAFHRVRPAGQPRDPFDSCPSISLDVLGALLEYVRDRFEVVGLNSLMQRRSGSKPLAAVTFDDGWRDNFDLAFPLLRELDIPATVFVTTGKIGDCSPLWQQVLGSAFRTATVEPGPAAHRLRRAIGLEDTRTLDMRCYHETVRAWKTLPACQREPLLLRACGDLGPAAGKHRLFLDEDEIREMSRGPVVFGSHGVSHSALPQLERPAMQAELAQSKKRLQEILGSEVDMLAYPYGDSSPEVVQEARRAGYRIACTTQGKRVGPKEDPLRLSRIVPGWDAGRTPHGLEEYLRRRAGHEENVNTGH